MKVTHSLVGNFVNQIVQIIFISQEHLLGMKLALHQMEFRWFWWCFKLSKWHYCNMVWKEWSKTREFYCNNIIQNIIYDYLSWKTNMMNFLLSQFVSGVDIQKVLIAKFILTLFNLIMNYITLLEILLT